MGIRTIITITAVATATNYRCSRQREANQDRAKETYNTKKHKRPATRGSSKEKGMLDLSSQQIDPDVSASSSDSFHDPYFAEREAPVVPKPAVIAAAVTSETAASVVVHNINTVQKEEADAKVYSVQPIPQKVLEQRHQPLPRKNVQKHHDTEAEDGIEVKQLRKFSVIQPPERFHEVVAGRSCLHSRPLPIWR